VGAAAGGPAPAPSGGKSGVAAEKVRQPE
jgi:hypothetical protein